MSNNGQPGRSLPQQSKRQICLSALEAAALLDGAHRRLEDGYCEGLGVGRAAEFVLRKLIRELECHADQDALITAAPWCVDLLSECVLLDSGDPLMDGFRLHVREKLDADPRIMGA